VEITPEAVAIAAAKLGCRVGASREEVDTAFRRAVREQHPDVSGDSVAFMDLVRYRAILRDAAGPDRRRGSRKAGDPKGALRRKDTWSASAAHSKLDLGL
jgi:hypothetical protein